MKEDDEPALNTIVWSYLRNVNEDLATNFRRITQARSLGKNVPTLAAIYQHFKETSPEAHRLNGKKGVKRTWTSQTKPENANKATSDEATNVDYDSSSSTTEQKIEVVDLTNLDCEPSSTKKRNIGKFDDSVIIIDGVNDDQSQPPLSTEQLSLNKVSGPPTNNVPALEAIQLDINNNPLELYADDLYTGGISTTYQVKNKTTSQDEDSLKNKNEPITNTIHALPTTSTTVHNEGNVLNINDADTEKTENQKIAVKPLILPPKVKNIHTQMTNVKNEPVDTAENIIKCTGQSPYVANDSMDFPKTSVIMKVKNKQELNSVRPEIFYTGNDIKTNNPFGKLSVRSVEGINNGLKKNYIAPSRLNFQRLPSVPSAENKSSVTARVVMLPQTSNQPINNIPGHRETNNHDAAVNRNGDVAHGNNSNWKIVDSNNVSVNHIRIVQGLRCMCEDCQQQEQPVNCQRFHRAQRVIDLQKRAVGLQKSRQAPQIILPMCQQQYQYSPNRKIGVFINQPTTSNKVNILIRNNGAVELTMPNLVNKFNGIHQNIARNPTDEQRTPNRENLGGTWMSLKQIAAYVKKSLEGLISSGIEFSCKPGDESKCAKEWGVYMTAQVAHMLRKRYDGRLNDQKLLMYPTNDAVKCVSHVFKFNTTNFVDKNSNSGQPSDGKKWYNHKFIDINLAKQLIGVEIPYERDSFGNIHANYAPPDAQNRLHTGNNKNSVPPDGQNNAHTVNNETDRNSATPEAENNPNAVNIENNINDVPPHAQINVHAVNSERDRNDNVYQQLLKIEENDLIANFEKFTCGVCLMDCEPGDGVMLHECLHSYCRDCLVNLIRHCEDAEVKCPYRSEDNTACVQIILDREIRALVTPEDYDAHLARGVRLAETTMEDAFHCRTPDCPGWCVHDDNVQVFQCPQCGKDNCLKCKVIHNNETCVQYRTRIERETEFSGSGVSGLKTAEAIDQLLKKGEVVRCPRCRVVVMKDKDTCDWVACVICKTEICWATKGPRWGPLGKGDTSGGCRCKLAGKKCHPRCRNCH